MQTKTVVDPPADTLAKMEAAEVSDTLVDVQEKVPVHTPAATITKVKGKTLLKHMAMWRPRERATRSALWMSRHRASRSANWNICRRSRCFGSLGTARETG